LVWQGWAWQGAVRPGDERRGKVFPSSSEMVAAGFSRHGRVQQGLALRGLAWCGDERQGKVFPSSSEMVATGFSRFGWAGPGVAMRGKARSGKARYKAVHPTGCAAFSLKTLILTHKYKYEIIYFTAR